MTDWIVFTQDQVRGIIALNDEERAIVPRLIDNANHPDFGGSVVQASIIAVPGYERFIEVLSAGKIIAVDPADLFAPQEDEE